jgi:hypothetical protein
MPADPREFSVRDLQMLIHDVLHEALTDQPMDSTTDSTHYDMSTDMATNTPPSVTAIPMDTLTDTSQQRPLIVETAQIEKVIAHAPRAQRITRREYDLLDG